MVTSYSTFKPKECLRAIQNLFASPKYTELKTGMNAKDILTAIVDFAVEKY